MKSERPFALSIAGFDPSGGAGILADVKVFEMHKVQGLGVCTSITFQNEKEFDGLNWVDVNNINKQIEVLLRLYKVDFVKIGLVKGLEELNEIVDELLKWNKDIKIIWDPILKASAGYDFHSDIKQELLLQILNKIYVITPNLEEIERLFPTEKDFISLSKRCIVYLKGGHGVSDIVEDKLFIQGQVYSFKNIIIENGEKHGSGCVLSSSITANLVKGFSMEETCEKAIAYTRGFLASNQTLLGYHNN